MVLMNSVTYNPWIKLRLKLFVWHSTGNNIFLRFEIDNVNWNKDNRIKTRKSHQKTNSENSIFLISHNDSCGPQALNWLSKSLICQIGSKWQSIIIMQTGKYLHYLWYRAHTVWGYFSQLFYKLSWKCES